MPHSWMNLKSTDLRNWAFLVLSPKLGLGREPSLLSAWYVNLDCQLVPSAYWILFKLKIAAKFNVHRVSYNLPDLLILTYNPSFSSIANRVTCQGKYQLRHQRPLYQKALNIQPKTFSDHENGCLFTPKSKEQRLQIGLGNEADSRFSIELSCDKHPGGETIIFFHINFIVDPTANARYQSAVFEVNFSQIEDDDGHERPLTIRDYEPKDQQGEATEVQVGRAVNNSLGVSGGQSLLSLSTLTSLSMTEQYTKKTASRVMGARASPSTVNWAFKEDEGRAGRNGLATTYTVHACIPSTGLTSIRFWAKAIVMRPRRPKVGLRIGSTESPSEKLLDLHFLHIDEKD